MEPESLLPCLEDPWMLFVILPNKFMYYGEELLGSRPAPNPENHPLSAIRECLLVLSVDTLHELEAVLYPQPEDAPCWSIFW
jgi:hypothetical protein